MATIAIGTPDPGFSGTRAGVTFQDGRGEVDADNAEALAYFTRHGYAIDFQPSPTKDVPPSPTKKAPRARAAEAPSNNDASIPTSEGEQSDA